METISTWLTVKFEIEGIKWIWTTELDRENLDFPPYLISHGQKIGLTRVLLAMRSEVADCLCAEFASLKRTMWTQHKLPWSCAKLSVSLGTLFCKVPTQPNFCSIAYSASICGGIGSPGSPYLILWYGTKTTIWAKSRSQNPMYTVSFSSIGPAFMIILQHLHWWN